MPVDVDAMVEGILAGKKLAVARGITLVENDAPEARDLLHALHPHTGAAHVIGITGSPGTGKSTLTDRLIEVHRRAGRRVGVIAVDPSSPFSGGAILGDRIRMQHRATDPEVFIRSMGSRGALGGLSSNTIDAVKVLDASGCDVILVETVGVGQAEVEVVRLADTVCVVLVPNLGDDVQAVKAGVMEIADIFVVNKGDLTGADKVHAEVEAAMGLGHPDKDVFWWAPIVRTSADKGQGITELATAIEDHAAWSKEHGEWHARRQRRLRDQVRALLERRITAFAFDGKLEPRSTFEAWFQEARDGDCTPQDVATRILDAFKQDKPRSQ